LDDPWVTFESLCDSHQSDVVLAICAVALLNFILAVIAFIHGRRLAKQLDAVQSSVDLMLRIEEKRLLDEARGLPKVMVLPPILRAKRSDTETAAGGVSGGRRIPETSV
jgi:hypothetical protein